MLNWYEPDLALFTSAKKGLKAAVNYFQSLLCYFSAQSLIVFAILAYMVIILVTKIFTLGKVILPDTIQGFIKQVFGKPAKSTQGCIFTHREIFKLIFYS